MLKLYIKFETTTQDKPKWIFFPRTVNKMLNNAFINITKYVVKHV
jgi:hypothetical protein